MWVDPLCHVWRCSSAYSRDLAPELGRFDLAVLVLAAVSIIVALSAFFAFFNVRSAAKKAAVETAQQCSEDAVRKYLELKGSILISEHL